MTKEQLLAEITQKVLKVVSTTEQADLEKNAAGIKSYITNVLEQDGNSVTGRNIGWYTLNEGVANEEAYYRDLVSPKKDFFTKFENYLNSLTPITYLRYKLESVDEVDRSGYARAVKKNQDGTGKEVRLFIYRDTVANAVAHVELT